MEKYTLIYYHDRYKGVIKKCNSRICISNTPTFYTYRMNYHPQGVRDEKVSSALAHLEHRERDGIDVVATVFSSEFCQGDIPSQFSRNSVVIPSVPRIFYGSNGFLTEPGFLFLHLPSVLGSN